MRFIVKLSVRKYGVFVWWLLFFERRFYIWFLEIVIFVFNNLFCLYKVEMLYFVLYLFCYFLYVILCSCVVGFVELFVDGKGEF